MESSTSRPIPKSLAQYQGLVYIQYNQEAKYSKSKSNTYSTRVVVVVISKCKIKDNNLITSLVGLMKPLGLNGSSPFGDQSLNHHRLDFPTRIRVSLSGVRIQQRRRRLLHQPGELVLSVVVPRRRFQQRQIVSVPFVGPRPKHLRYRRFLWDHPRP